MKKKNIVIIILSILLLLGILSINIFLNNRIKTRVVKSGNYEIKNSNVNKFRITDMDELNAFYSLIDPNFDEKEFSNLFEIKEKDFKNSVVFLMHRAEGSGSIDNQFLGVELNNGEVELKIDSKSESKDFMTDDMAYWYFIVNIPNKDLKGINIGDWSKPSDIKTKYNFNIVFNEKVKGFSNAINTLEEIINKTGGILVEEYEGNIDEGSFKIGIPDYPEVIEELINNLDKDSRIKNYTYGISRESLASYDELERKISFEANTYKVFTNINKKIDEKTSTYIQKDLEGEIIKNPDLEGVIRDQLIIEFDKENSEKIEEKIKLLDKELNDYINDKADISFKIVWEY